MVGRYTEDNISGIREIVNHVLDWELRSGVTFKDKKTALIYFIRNSRLQGNSPINIKDSEVLPCTEIKILGVL